MHASDRREVQAILLREPWFAQLLPAQAQEAGRQDRAERGEALGGGHEVGTKSIGRHAAPWSGANLKRRARA